MRSIRLVIQACVLAAVTLGVGACNVEVHNWSQAHHERTAELQEAMADGGSLAVSTASGSIDVAGQAVSEIRIVAKIRGQAPTEDEARELAEATEIRIERSGDRVTIKADTPRQGNGRSVSVSYDIVVPTRTSVECESASGGIKVAGLEGSVRGHTASGSVAGEDLRNGSVNLDSSSGSVRLSNASGITSCEMHTSSGWAAAERVRAESIRIGSNSGSVELRDARAGTIDMRGASGRVEGRNIDCSHLNAESASGGVSIEFSPTAPADVTATIGSISGGVHVVAPRDFAGRIEMSTTSGSVESNLPVTVQGKMSTKHLSGTVGSGSGSLTLRTTSGSVHVR
ncbi:MAG TPA: DUF4097 family beta strand repeat-containing protein [Phycisphaerae bacterium]|nr:DUF4097 family beta strand repeat-containing protein [Phycisphaerae bacterium]